MTRFNITLDEGVDLILWSIKNTFGGEIIVPKLASYRILDLAEAIAPNCKKEVVGIRPGEKIHEEMITSSDSFTTIEFGNKYAILPTGNSVIKKYEIRGIKFKNVEAGFSYNSGNNDHFLSVQQIRSLILKNIDKNFKPK